MSITDFLPGYRVQAHPATDLFMRGVRYGDVRKVTRTHVHVKFDHLPRTIALRPELVVFVDYAPPAAPRHTCQYPGSNPQACVACAERTR